MDFEEHDDQDQDQDPDEEMEEIPTAPPGYDSSSARPIPKPGAGTDGGASSTIALRKSVIRYRECLKNHAVSIGGNAVDGCCEFMAAGEEGTLDALKCAACNCHRNFHRKECTEDGSGAGGGAAASASLSDHHHHNNYQLYHHGHGHQFSSSPFYRAPPPSGYLHLTSPTAHQSRPLALPGVSSGGGQSREDGEDVSIPSSSGGGSGSSKKRFRTKFTVEQKEKLLEFAERVGWRIQKHDEAAVEQFCLETGVTRHVLKVWMHNNKHTLGKKP